MPQDKAASCLATSLDKQLIAGRVAAKSVIYVSKLEGANCSTMPKLRIYPLANRENALSQGSWP